MMNHTVTWIARFVKAIGVGMALKKIKRVENICHQKERTLSFLSLMAKKKGVYYNSIGLNAMVAVRFCFGALWRFRWW